ncbi:MAG: hypothetical protein DKM50_06150 [Candidatus Margulisiibacteriota bacterium]|nr:MAG: hypothetical protein A2X43_10205 [Candidatus Margulisbacteria bacterium GWD2_39_127]OGI05447.1 MAG: hypothetical protein A2X42_09305 [Candidatus Margulisbacteria bacterium GWF2_38_17]OGI07815.1 MAG: hypothetical protein A2X41_11850 [Candidatus Margulisbacteria bacterium GWE2_39_32]PZM80129.1 MAG: hypothetical protein DKM50_06150 [Candidatus Margulisiibacteriota bacterium]HAR62605.1 hypothetical protein [Candidatus Margulisiibacteriota bacterium]
MADWLSITWIIVGIVVICVLLFFIPILVEVRKTLKAYRVISERIELVTDVKGWLNFANFFKKEKKRDKI